MTITLHKSDTVPNVHDENEESNENFVTEVRAYLEEQERETSKERNTRQISGCKHQLASQLQISYSIHICNRILLQSRLRVGYLHGTKS